MVGTCRDGQQDMGTATSKMWEPIWVQRGSEISPSSNCVQMGATSGVLLGHWGGAEVPKACLVPPPCVLARANGSSSLTCAVLLNRGTYRVSPWALSWWQQQPQSLTAPIPSPLQGPPATTPKSLGYRELAGGRIQPGAFGTISYMKHLLAANCCSQGPGALLCAFSRLQSKQTDSFSSAA